MEYLQPAHKGCCYLCDRRTKALSIITVPAGKALVCVACFWKAQP